MAKINYATESPQTEGSSATLKKTRQLAFDFPSNTGSNPSSPEDEPELLSVDAPSSTAPFAGSEEIDVDAIKAANRAVARQTSEEERRRLWRQQGALAAKKVAEGLTAREEMELTLLRWQLDCIEDALAGETLDIAENAIEQQEDLARSIEDLLSKLNPKRSRKRR